MAERHLALRALLAGRFPAGAPGVAVGVIEDGRVAFAEGFGEAALSPTVPFTARSAFRACSISKQLVCLLVLQAAREGRLALDDHPARHVPALAALPPSLTLRHLCQNRSGLPDYWCAAMLTGARAESAFTLADGRALIGKLTRPMFAPGAQYRYSNGNWRILEEVLEAATGEALPDLMATRIFAPLGMDASYWGQDTGAPLPGGETGYVRGAAGWEVEVTRMHWSGDAALVTTLDDMLTWEAAMLAGTLPCSRELFDPMPHPGGAPGTYAFGVNVLADGARAMQWHSGALRGWRMVQVRFPAEQGAVVVMMNRTENPMPLALEVAARMGWPPAWDIVADQGIEDDFPAWRGWYDCEELGITAELHERGGAPTLDLGGDGVALVLASPGVLSSANGFYRIARAGGELDIATRHYGWQGRFRRRAEGDARALLAGRRYRCDVLASELAVAPDGRSLAIEGPHGTSERYRLRAAGAGAAAFDCLRALDELPPGRFDVRLAADGDIVVGCFMAAGFRWTPTG